MGFRLPGLSRARRSGRPLPGRDRRPGRDRWDTWEPPRAHVLCVARTLTSATRLLDVLPLLRREDGIETYYTVNPGSAFAEGLHTYFASLGVGDRLLSWEEATRRPFDLAVACTVNNSMRQLDAPLVVLPHGAGYNRLVTETTGDASAPAGLSRRELTWRGKVIPAAIGVSHSEQLGRLAGSCPEAVERAAVVGDICLDRIRRSLPLRDRYRALLGAVDGRRLVVLHSTWSSHSLLGTHPELPLELVTSLPADEYAVAAVLHPNVWARHSRRGVLERLERAMDAGLLVIPPEEGWRAAVVAGDWVVGDHGSTSLYSAALDRTVLLAATGLDELDAASPTAGFARRAPRLDVAGDLHAQLLRADAEHDPEVLGPVVESQWEAPDKSTVLTQDLLYGLLADAGVGAPAATPEPEPVPDPKPLAHRAPTAFDVTGRVGADGAVEVQRYPLAPRHAIEPRGFYAVTDEETHPLWPQSADVLARTLVDAATPPTVWAEEAFRRLPGLSVVGAALDTDRCLVRVRDGRVWEAQADRPWGAARARLDPVLLACAVHVAASTDTGTAGGTELGAPLVIRTGRHLCRVSFRVAPGE
ncbi:hypothetical protein [Streptomyces koyangensis]